MKILTKNRNLILKSVYATLLLTATNFVFSADKELETLISEAQATEIVRVISERAAIRNLTDYEKVLYSSSLIDVGRLSEGVRMLETYLVNDPQSTRAKLELARGYYRLGKLDRSKTFFANVKEQENQIPKAVQDNISRYERLIEQRQADLIFKYRPSIEVGLGYDDNVNGGVNQPNITLPFFGPVQISQSGQAQKSSYQRVKLALDFSRPIDWQWSFFGNAALEGKRHTIADEFDSVNSNASAGLAYVAGANTIRTSLSYFNQRLNNASNRYIPNLGIDYSRQFDDWSFNAGVNHGLHRHIASQSIRDISYTNYSLGARYRLPFATDMAPTLVASYTRGTENSRRQREDLSKNSKNLRLGFELTPYVGGALFGAASRANAIFNADDQFYGLTRVDRNNAFEIGLRHNFSEAAAVLFSIASSENSSNVELFKNKRKILDIAFRYSFK